MGKIVQTLIFLDLFQKACIHFFDTQRAVKAYGYFLKNKKYIMVTLEQNKTLDSEECFDVLFILDFLKTTIYIKKYKIYYRELPYEYDSLKEIPWNIFYSQANKFFEEGGEIIVNGGSKIRRLEIEKRILEEFDIKEVNTSLFNHVYQTGTYRRDIDLVHKRLIEDREKAHELNGKDYLELGLKKFITHIKQNIDKNFSESKAEFLFALMKDK